MAEPPRKLRCNTCRSIMRLGPKLRRAWQVNERIRACKDCIWKARVDMSETPRPNMTTRGNDGQVRGSRR